MEVRVSYETDLRQHYNRIRGRIGSKAVRQTTVIYPYMFGPSRPARPVVHRVDYKVQYGPFVTPAEQMSILLAKVAEKYGVEKSDILGASRLWVHTRPRHEFWFRCIAELKWNLVKTAARTASTGKRDHTTILAGIRSYAFKNGLDLPPGYTFSGRLSARGSAADKITGIKFLAPHAEKDLGAKQRGSQVRGLYDGPVLILPGVAPHWR
jgi:hypothetical protein